MKVVRRFSLQERAVKTTLMFNRAIQHMKDPTSIEVSEARFKRFLRELHTYEQKLTFEHTLDAFLDLYSSWKKTHEHALKLRLVMLAFELHRLNRDFECDLTFQDDPRRCARSS